MGDSIRNNEKVKTVSHMFNLFYRYMFLAFVENNRQAMYKN
jgi:hypothetical protein